ncbi:hypothetical protein B0H67DRAFT_630235 [Lasiosphaeris hirsuta]|uniref:Peptidase C1A papain C-terminal domain-containing protein n=1 Tax=Lasiosphaeris hirsuta TaxID=260670 RepID=A0AA40B8I1_9PEZI|nr:hypothetical protein B0H67DRAFT_630235 [Lasiosphaeris hirsuta]
MTQVYTTTTDWPTLDPLFEPALALAPAPNQPHNIPTSNTTSPSRRAANRKPTNDTPLDRTVPISARALPSAVDWRQRWGRAWLTTTQDQGRCGSCWAFAATALLEAQTRIEHGVWGVRAAADLLQGSGSGCAAGGRPDEALAWAADHGGVPDEECLEYEEAGRFYLPCGDRAGRTVQFEGVTARDSVVDQKRWLANVGPLTACFDTYSDFHDWDFTGKAAYKPSAKSKVGESHCVLVVGYDDEVGGWLFKNSWGATFGDGGYGYIKYGAVRIDDGPKYGITNVNPDPWSKKSHHNGILYQSGSGKAHRNFEVVRADPAGAMSHVSRKGEAPYGWFQTKAAAALPNGVMVEGQTAYGQPVITGTSFNRDYEVVYVSTTGSLIMWYYSQSQNKWVYNERGLEGLEGYPGFVQTDDSAFSLVVRTSSGNLQEWIRNPKTGRWSTDERVVSIDIQASGPSLVQSNIGLDSSASRGNLYVVGILNTGQMQMFYRTAASSSWVPGEIFGDTVGVTPPVMIQDYWTADEKAFGGFQLLVAVDGKVQHWERGNDDIITNPPAPGSSGPWAQVRTFGEGEVKHVWGLVQGSFGGALDAIVEDHSGDMWHWRFSGSPSEWRLVDSVPVA